MTDLGLMAGKETMSNESKALELAARMDGRPDEAIICGDAAADELRRQHAALQDLQTECTALRVNEENLTAQVESLRSQLAARVPDVRLANLDGVIPNAVRGYLRRCSSGGMSKKQVDTVQANVDEAERLGYFKLAIAEAMLSAAPSQQAPAQECEWTNCPRRVGDVCCNEQQAPVAQGEPVGVVDAVSEQGFHVAFSESLPVGTKLYTTTQQASEPMTVEQIWENEQLMALNAVMGLPMQTIESIVGIVEQFHKIRRKQ